MYNVALNLSTTIFLMSIQQNQQSIHGYFLDEQAHGVRVQEPFLGIVDAPDQVQFSVVKEKEHIKLSFNGLIQPDGTLGGSYCSLNSEGQCAGERGGYGVWSAIPVSGRAFIGSGDTKLYAFNASGFTHNSVYCRRIFSGIHCSTTIRYSFLVLNLYEHPINTSQWHILNVRAYSRNEKGDELRCRMQNMQTTSKLHRCITTYFMQ